ncbi:MAG TPA: hypothetical protein VF665_12910 [Longimicrobium sp.]|jgi:hypothetical protein|uniref:hypothetical protein n=1 Tax=Longimicrobium sp. TaxID=2029185 RepID=UPI002EDA3379
MMHAIEDNLVETPVTYSVEVGGQFVRVENVPARVDPETGERFFSREAVDQFSAIMWSGRPPDRVNRDTGIPLQPECGD